MTNEIKIKTANEYFAQKAKFFETGDANGKKAFFLLGQYCKKIMECQEKEVAENGEENKFQKKLTQLVRPIYLSGLLSPYEASG